MERERERENERERGRERGRERERESGEKTIPEKPEAFLVGPHRDEPSSKSGKR